MFMDNNLNTMILRSGLTKRTVAEQKGITPETLSRHISGKIQLALNDAENYSQILACTPQEILFANDPVPIIGYIHYDNSDDNIIDWIETRKEKSKYHKTSPGGNVYLRGPIHFNLGVVMFDLPNHYNGPWIEYKNALSVVQIDPIKNNVVATETIQQASYAKIRNGEVVFGHIYPEPGGLHTVHNPRQNDLLSIGTETRRGLQLDWATPVICTYWQPLLRGIDIIYNKH
tara:strand:- start:89 stop:778 length:690 start_codon:yes stop_codon:yes gene_type:complete